MPALSSVQGGVICNAPRTTLYNYAMCIVLNVQLQLCSTDVQPLDVLLGK